MGPHYYVSTSINQQNDNYQSQHQQFVLQDSNIPVTQQQIQHNMNQRVRAPVEYYNIMTNEARNVVQGGDKNVIRIMSQAEVNNQAECDNVFSQDNGRHIALRHSTIERSSLSSIRTPQPIVPPDSPFSVLRYLSDSDTIFFPGNVSNERQSTIKSFVQNYYPTLSGHHEHTMNTIQPASSTNGEAAIAPCAGKVITEEESVHKTFLLYGDISKNNTNDKIIKEFAKAKATIKRITSIEEQEYSHSETKANGKFANCRMDKAENPNIFHQSTAENNNDDIVYMGSTVSSSSEVLKQKKSSCSSTSFNTATMSAHTVNKGPLYDTSKCQRQCSTTIHLLRQKMQALQLKTVEKDKEIQKLKAEIKSSAEIETLKQNNFRSTEDERLKSFWNVVPLFKNIITQEKFHVNQYLDMLKRFEKEIVLEYFNLNHVTSTSCHDHLRVPSSSSLHKNNQSYHALQPRYSMESAPITSITTTVAPESPFIISDQRFQIISPVDYQNTVEEHQSLNTDVAYNVDEYNVSNATGAACLNDLKFVYAPLGDGNQAVSCRCIGNIDVHDNQFECDDIDDDDDEKYEDVFEGVENEQSGVVHEKPNQIMNGPLSPSSTSIKRRRSSSDETDESIPNEEKIEERKIKKYFRENLSQDFLESFKNQNFKTDVVVSKSDNQKKTVQLRGSDLVPLFTKGRMNCVVNIIILEAFNAKIPQWYVKRGSDKNKKSTLFEDIHSIRNAYKSVLDDIKKFTIKYNNENNTNITLPKKYTNIKKINWSYIITTRARVLRCKMNKKIKAANKG